MLHKKTLLFFLLFFFSLRAFSAIFVVTSNADSGPGTLRDALTQAAANGSATTDYINFNLPDLSEAGRTITISSQLPLISSNLVIDGTTQPGGSFGVSNASVILQPVTSSSIFNAFVLINVDGFQIYGMYIRDFFGVASFNISAGLYVRASKNIQIGAPGKGNVFANVGYVISSGFAYYYDSANISPDGVENLSVYSNFFGFEPDGVTLRGQPDGYSGAIDLDGCKGTIEIGGININRRNIFGNSTMAIRCGAGLATLAFPTSFLIENNYFNYNVNGRYSPLPNINSSDIFSIFVQADVGNSFRLPYTFSILNNTIQFPTCMSIGPVSGKVFFQGNQVINDPYPSRPGYASAVGFFSTDAVLVGGINPGEANSLYGTQVEASSQVSALVQHNSIYCAYSQIPYLNYNNTLPQINITNVTANSVSGTATPKSTVELFWDDNCQTCQPLTYITSVTADANGIWTYNGVINNGVIASATLNQYTSEFTSAALYGGAHVVHYACGVGGSITGGTFYNTGGYQWENEKNQIIGTDPTINNLTPGTYTLTALNGSCSTNYSFTILDATPKIDDKNIALISPSCGNDKGSITGIYVDNYDVIYDAESAGIYNAYTYKWTDASGTVVGTSSDLTNVPAGTYHLEVSYMGECVVPYGPVTLKNVSGPNIDQSNPTIQSTNCGQSTGSITNLSVTGTGTLKYIWWNNQQQTVGTTKDLLGQPAGTYKLEVTDDSQCGPVYTTDMTIPETNGITMDETKATTSVSSCSKNNGSITGITVSGATAYQWVDGNNKPVGQSVDLQNQPSGDYTLTASNSFGCSKTSQTYHIGQDPPTQYPVYASTVIPSCFGKNNGSVSVATDLLVSSARWINSQGAPAGGNTAQLTDVPAGTYQLYVTDKNGCENLYNSYTVTTIPQLQILPGSEKIVDDQCILHTGGITNIQVSGGVQPYTWSWVDGNNKIVASSPDLIGVGAGVYTLNVNDASGCGLVSASYTVQNQIDNIPAPVISNLQLCSAGDALLQVNNPSAAYTYRLYDSQTGTTPIDEQANGNFKITVKSNTTYYVSQLSGDCESPRSAVQVSVGITAVDIANAFTPNGDGINDYWVINGIASYPSAIVQVFTRNGQKIFESKGYTTPFDGTFNGKQLPSGVYYYIINLKSNCNLLSGSLTIIR